MDAQRQQRLSEQVTYWQQQGVQNEVERRNLARAAGIGAGLSALAGLWHWQVAAWGLVIALLVFVIAMYMTWVRRGEFRENAREAAASLAEEAPAQPPVDPSRS